MTAALPFQTAKQLAAAIRKKKIGCLELLDLYLKRVETYNPALNAIIATDIDGARTRAKAADKAVKAGKKLGPLHGVPMTIKESFDVAGYPTTWGLPAFKDHKAEKNSLVAQRMIDAGVDARSARPTCRCCSPTTRATTTSTARPTIRGTRRARPAARRAARPRRWPPA